MKLTSLSLQSYFLVFSNTVCSEIYFGWHSYCFAFSLFMSIQWLSQLRLCLQCGRLGFDPWVGKIPGLGRSPEEGKGYPLQYSGLENSMGYIIHGVTKSWTGLSDFHFHFKVQLSQVAYSWVLVCSSNLTTSAF